jgi:hypothetical protein
MSLQLRIEELAERYIDEVLTEDESEELNQLSQSSSEARQHFLKRTDFDALINESRSRPGMPEDSSSTSDTPTSAGSPWRSVLALAACGVFGFFLNGVLQDNSRPSSSPSSNFLAQVTHVSSNSNVDLKSGKYLENKVLNFSEGVAEITMFNGAKLTVQGPANVRLNSLNEVVLSEGLVSVKIPVSVHDFKVRTPGERIGSAGSEFGVKVTREGLVETHVFKGVVEIEDHNGKKLESLQQHQALRFQEDKSTLVTLQNHLFPGMRGTTDNLLVSGNFEQGTIISTGKFPQSFNQWSGDIAEIVGPENGIVPAKGKGMLRFLHTYNSSTPNDPIHSTSNSQVFCFIDLRESFPNGIPEGSQLVATCKVNRVTGDVQTDNRFNLRLSILSELPNGMKDHIETHYESTASKSIDTDAAPSTWENLNVILNAQPKSQYVSLEISALENIHSDITDTVELDGHYLDDLKLTLLKPPTPAPLLVSSI